MAVVESINKAILQLRSFVALVGAASPLFTTLARHFAISLESLTICGSLYAAASPCFSVFLKKEDASLNGKRSNPTTGCFFISRCIWSAFSATGKHSGLAQLKPAPVQHSCPCSAVSYGGIKQQLQYYSFFLSTIEINYSLSTQEDKEQGASYEKHKLAVSALSLSDSYLALQSCQ